MNRPPDEGQNKDLQWKVLDALQRRRNARHTGDPPRRVKALVLARACGIRVGGSNESRKKGLRNVVRALREQGIEIASDLKDGGGYWLPVDAHDHAQYRAFLRRQAMARLAEESRSKRSQATADAAGQFSMFDTTGGTPRASNCALLGD
jgi:hypothetical protein